MGPPVGLKSRFNNCPVFMDLPISPEVKPSRTCGIFQRLVDGDRCGSTMR
jgi:hypothetical protein